MAEIVEPAKSIELDRAVRLVSHVCHVAGNRHLINHVRRDLARRGVRAAIRHHNTLSCSIGWSR
jgi:hypothetical protein